MLIDFFVNEYIWKVIIFWVGSPRLRRKNRRPNSCGVSIDSNRNIGFHWNA